MKEMLETSKILSYRVMNVLKNNNNNNNKKKNRRIKGVYIV